MVSFGKKYEFDAKEFPKPGTALTLLLNRRYIERLQSIKEEVIAADNPSAQEMRIYTLKAVKIMMDYDYGVAMANKPKYTASRRGKIAYIEEVSPGMPRTMTLEKLYNKYAYTQDELPKFIDEFIELSRASYEKMLDVEEKILKG